jgi:hypothetical protein
MTDTAPAAEAAQRRIQSHNSFPALKGMNPAPSFHRRPEHNRLRC